MYNLHEMIGISVPTNNPDIAFAYLLDSLENMKEIAPYATFLFNFQKPWNDELISKAINIVKSYGFDVKYSFNQYEVIDGSILFNKIRSDACELMPEAQYYLLMDDDMTPLKECKYSKFSYGHQLLHCLSYMIDHPNCGVITLDKNRQSGKGSISPVHNQSCWNGRGGNLVRSINNKLFPDEALNLLGWGEESVICAHRLSKGLYHARLVGASCYHYENFGTIRNGVEKSTAEKDPERRKRSIAVARTNNYKYIKSINPEYSGYNDYHLCTEEQYQASGGVPHLELLHNPEYIYMLDNTIPNIEEKI